MQMVLGAEKVERRNTPLVSINDMNTLSFEYKITDNSIPRSDYKLRINTYDANIKTTAIKSERLSDEMRFNATLLSMTTTNLVQIIW